jgi:hypothetical protein
MDLIPVLVARDRSGAMADFLLEEVSKACLSQALHSSIQSYAMLCAEGSAAMAVAAKELRVQHEAVNLSLRERMHGPWHTQKRQRGSRQAQSLAGSVQGRRHVLLGKLPWLVSCA